MKIFLSAVALFSGLNSYAAIQQKSTAVIVAPYLRENTSFIGGQAGRGFSILDIRRTQDLKRQQERLVLDIGDLNGAPLKGKTGFYHVEYRDKKMIISFSQMPKTLMSKESLLKISKGSLSLEKTYFIEEADNSTMKLVLEFKSKPRVKIFDIKGQKTTAKLIVDLYK